MKTLFAVVFTILSGAAQGESEVPLLPEGLPENFREWPVEISNCKLNETSILVKQKYSDGKYARVNLLSKIENGIERPYFFAGQWGLTPDEWVHWFPESDGWKKFPFSAPTSASEYTATMERVYKREGISLNTLKRCGF